MLHLIWKNIWHKKLSLAMSLLLLALGTGIISMLLLIEKSISSKLDADLRGTELVVGAKGSPLQLVLSAIYHTDAPTGNISLAEVEKLGRNPMVEWWIPLSYGDTYRGSRIVGTTPRYLQLYHAQLASGRVFAQPMEVVAGAAIASRAGLQPGSSFTGTHGEGGEEHKEHPYKVVGVLQPTGTVLDGLLLTPTETVWAVHHHEEEEEAADSTNAAGSHAAHDHEARHTPEADHDHDEEPVQITAALFKFRSPMALMTMPRLVNAQTNMQAANPVVEVRRLMTLLSVGADTLKAIGGGIMLVSALSIFIALYLRLQERRYEMALLRSMGCPRSGLLWLVLGEGLLIALAGTALGLALSRLGLWLLQGQSASGFQLRLLPQWLPAEWWLVLLTVGLGTLAALLPAIKAFGLNISKTLAHEA